MISLSILFRYTFSIPCRAPTTPDLRPVWAFPLSLAATHGISNLISIPVGTKMFQFPTFAFITYVLSNKWQDITPAGFPHSEISGSKPVNDSPKLIAAYHVLHRLPMPRHPPLALNSLSIKLDKTFKLLTPVTFKPDCLFYSFAYGGHSTGVPEYKIQGLKGFSTTLLFNYQRSVLHIQNLRSD